VGTASFTPPASGGSSPKLSSGGAGSTGAILPPDPNAVPVFTNKATNLGGLVEYDRKKQTDLKVPLLMARTLAHMFDVGLNTEGLFRVPGNSGKMAIVEEEYNKGRGGEVDFKKRMVSCEDSASLLKKFLRDALPEELFTAKLSDKFRAILGTRAVLQLIICSPTIPKKIM